MSMSGPRGFLCSAKAWEYLRRNTATIKAQELSEKLSNDILQIRNGMRNGTSARATILVPSDEHEGYFAKLERNGVLTDNLSSASDISNAYLACKMLLAHLEERRVLELLPQVFDILRVYQFLQYKRNKDVLNLRLVSKAWKNAAEEQFLGPTGFSKADWYLRRDEEYNSMSMDSPFFCCFETVEDVECAINIKTLHTSKSPPCSSPSLLRLVDINIKVADDDDECIQVKNRFISKLEEFLDLHGHGEHVWGLLFTRHFDYESICKLVSHMPNLKELYVNCWDRSSYKFHLDEYDEKRLIAQFPFPTIPSLERVVFDNISQCKLLIAEILERNQKSIRTFSVEDEDPGELEELFPTLANLQRLECFDFKVGPGKLMYFSDIWPLRQMNWPLRVLNLSRANAACDLVTVNVGRLFDIINRFKGTLEAIDLDAVILKDGDGTNNVVVVNFPKLKVINKVWTFCST